MTEEVTGIDVPATQLRIASGASLEDIGLVQENIIARGVAIQVRRPFPMPPTPPPREPQP